MFATVNQKPQTLNKRDVMQLREKVNTVITNAHSCSISLSVRATLLCVTSSVSASVWANFPCRAPLSNWIPFLFSTSLFSPRLSPWGRDTTHFAQYCQIKSRCPLLSFSHSTSLRPPIITKHTVLLDGEHTEVGANLLYYGGYEKDVWISEVMWEEMRQDCHQPVSQNQSSSW